jgi:periplasmic protein TonB
MIDFDYGWRASRRLWIGAAAGAFALHLGGAAWALAHFNADDPDDAMGTPAIEIALEMTSPKVDQTDLPAGPDTDASVASPALAEQKAEVKETDLPKDKPDETEDADRIVTPNDVKKPVQDEAKVATIQTQASQESVAAEATATPSVDNIPEGPHSAAPAQGTGSTMQRMRSTWQKELMAHLDKHKRYPADRVLKSAEIMVGFVLDRMGHVLSTSIIKGSGDPAFDAAAIDMVRRSDPVPAPPPLIADEGLNFTLPVIFKVRGKS